MCCMSYYVLMTPSGPSPSRSACIMPVYRVENFFAQWTRNILQCLSDVLLKLVESGIRATVINSHKVVDLFNIKGFLDNVIYVEQESKLKYIVKQQKEDLWLAVVSIYSAVRWHTTRPREKSKYRIVIGPLWDVMDILAGKLPPVKSSGNHFFISS